MKIIEGENYCIYLKRRSLVLETESTYLSMGWFEDENLAIVKLGVLELKEDYPSDGNFRMNVLHIQVMRLVFSFSIEWTKN